MPKTPKGKHSAGAGKPGGPSKGQGSFSVIGKIGWKLLGLGKKGKGFDNPGR